MNSITNADLINLANATGDQLVSLYLPLAHGAENRQGLIRLGNLLREAEEQLCDRGLRRPAAQDILAPARLLLDETSASISEAQVPAVGAFLGGETTGIFQLPVECGQRCIIARNFHLLPLVSWFAEQSPYHVLAVSQNSVRFFSGSRGGLVEQPVPELPASLRDALHYDQREGMYQAHSAGPQLPGKESLVFHGQGGAVDAAEAELPEFLRQIDRALANVLRLRTAPLVFAGVDYLFPIYEQVNTYSHLLPTAIRGNPELWSAGDLHERAWPLIEPLFERRREHDLDRYGDWIPLGRTADKFAEIIPAAHLGAVETLFVDPAAKLMGTFDAEHCTVRLTDPNLEISGASEEDLINLATVLVLRNSGAVDTPGVDCIPGGGPLAAIMRYPFRPLIENLGAPLEARRGS